MSGHRVRKYLAFGSGAAIEIGRRDLRVVAVRVRPSGISVLGTLVLAGFRERPAAEWGAAYSAFMGGLGLSHVAATVLLPRREVIVRTVPLPGVSDKDVGAAISYQLDSLHPYEEGDVLHGWARIGNGANILAGIAHRQLLARYLDLFAEAGIRVTSFTASVGALHAALRFPGAQLPEEFLAFASGLDDAELYGESESHPLFSASVSANPAPGEIERAAALASAELRLAEPAVPVPLAELLPQPVRGEIDLASAPLPYAAALVNACPWMGLGLNLLPPEMRTVASRWMYAPTAALLAILMGVTGLLLYERSAADRRYITKVEAEIARLEPAVARAAALDRQIEDALDSAQGIDSFRRRSQSDLDAMAELTRVLKAPVWLSQMELNRETVTIQGEADQAAGLLQVLDSSPVFRNSEFSMNISRAGIGEGFRIRAAREDMVLAKAPAEVAE